MRGYRIFLLFQLVIFIKLTEQKVLDDYIRHYEELSYDTHELHSRHLRAKRSVSDKNLQLKFRAHNRDFHLSLHPSKSIFTPDFKMVHNNGTEEEADVSFIYDGVVVGEPGSKVHGAVLQGIFRGVIRIPGDSNYHVETSWRFFPKENYRNLPFHSVIYKEDHLNLDPYRHKREAEKSQGGCALEEHWAKMMEMVDSEVQREKRDYTYTEEEKLKFNKYSAFANNEKRQKRATTSCSIGSRNTCNLFLRADPILFNEINGQLQNENAAKDEILAFFASHVEAINNIYSGTRFETYSKNVCYIGVQFQVQRTTIMTDATEQCSSFLQQTRFCNPNMDVSNFLNLNSLQNHNSFCLAYLFTYRDFTQGTLGLAWVGSPSRSAGGICQKFKTFTEGSTQTKKSLNTGVVTIVNYGKRVAPRVSQLTFAHEVGHNFGSPHDNGPSCAPYGTNQPDANLGNYIMFASATQGNREHNDEFSICSRDNMTLVMQSVFDEKYDKVNCFAASDVAFCGNGIVEEGEECDCGYTDDCKDQCCNARNEGEVQSANACKRRTKNDGSKVDCSPSEGPCCDVSCSFVSSASNQICRVATDCMEQQRCNGVTAKCPNSTKKPDMTYCNSKSQVCKSGYCTGSVCERIGFNGKSNWVPMWEECFQLGKGSKLTVQEKERLCLLSCKLINGSECIVSSRTSNVGLDKNQAFKDLLLNMSSPVTGVKLPAGSPCNNYRGYCDVFHKCRGVDSDGPLQRLKNLIFSEETLTNIKNWIIEHWWAVMLMGLGLILLMGLFIKFCAVHTPSSNPNAKPAKSLSDTLRRRPRRNPQQPYQQTRHGPGPSDPPPPYSAHGGPQQGHRRNDKGKKGGKHRDPHRDLELGRI